MKSTDLIAQFERMLDEHWAYEYGAAREGCVDCSGAFVYAFKQFGQTIAHGSNTIARDNILSMCMAEKAKPGWSAFKRRLDDGEPAKYQGDGWGNFYHIGLISRDGQHVLNAKGEKYGFCEDKLDDKWTFACPLKGVEYEEVKPMEAIYRAVVATEKDPLRVRSWPVTGRILGHVPKGKTVEVTGEGEDGWPMIRYGELEGYASAQYLMRVYEADPETPIEVHPPDEADGSAIRIAREDALRIYEALADAYRTMGAALSVD